VLFAVFVSASLPTTVAVFGIVPVWFAVVTRVTVTVWPTLTLPIWQLSIAPPVQVPCVDVEET